jgi:hypothetical protein
MIYEAKVASIVSILSDLVETMDGRQDEQQRVLTQSWPLMYGHVMTSQDYLNRLTESTGY